MTHLSLAVALLGLGISAAFAQQAKVGTIEVDNAWAPAANKTANDAAYMRLVGLGAKPDELVSATSPVAQKVELHVFDVRNGVFGMHPVDGIEVAPGAAATVLRPGGAHVMLEGLNRPLKAGESFPLSLTFKNAGQVQVEVSVRGRSAVVGQGAN